jgi:hypothetical protein
VLAELVRTRDHLDLPLKLHFWRTKEGEEIDFLVAVHGPGRPRWIAIEAKFSNQQVDAMAIPPALAREFSDLHEIWIVTPGGTETRLSAQSRQVPIRQLAARVREAQLLNF